MANMGAVPAAEAAFRLETIGRDEDMDQAEQGLAELKDEFRRLQLALTRVSKQVNV